MIGNMWKKRSILTLVSHEADEPVLRWYARLLDGRGGFGNRVVRGDVYGTPGRGSAITARPYARVRRPESEVVRGLAETLQIGFLVADWNREVERLQDLLTCAADLDIPAVLVRQSSLQGIRRVVVATAGGLHTTQQLWIAKEISDALGVPLRLVHVADREPGVREARGALPQAARVEHWASRLLGIDAEAECLAVRDPVDGIVQLTREHDLLVMGAPSRFQVAERFRDSVPAQVARRVGVPLVLLSAGRLGQVTLRRLFWGGLILPGLRAPDKRTALAALVDALVRHHQVPLDAGPALVEQALRRERAMTTAIDCETAFPHVRWPGFRGVAGSMAVCPDGLPFGSPDGSLTRFIFLLVTPDGYCEEHLAAQASIARRMLRPEVRAAILECASAGEVLDVLDPPEDTRYVPALRAASPAARKVAGAARGCQRPAGGTGAGARLAEAHAVPCSATQTREEGGGNT